MITKTCVPNFKPQAGQFTGDLGHGFLTHTWERNWTATSFRKRPWFTWLKTATPSDADVFGNRFSKIPHKVCVNSIKANHYKVKEGVALLITGSFSKPRWRRELKRHQTKRMSGTLVLHVHLESLYVSLPSSEQRVRELKQTTKTTATKTSLNKRFNKQNNSCARAL